MAMTMTGSGKLSKFAGCNKYLDGMLASLPDLYGSADAERSVLGAILLENDVAIQAAEKIRVEDFSLDSHRRIYLRMMELTQRDQPVDIITLVEKLKRNKEVEAIGGVAYLSSLTEGLPRRENIDHYGDIMLRYAKRRRIMESLFTGLQMCCDGSEGNEDILAVTEARLLEVQSGIGGAKSGPKRIGDVVEEVYSDIGRLRRTDGKVMGLTYGVAVVDAATTGMRAGELTVVGGWPGSGKSAFALNCALDNARAGVPVAMFSVEMTEQAVTTRTVSVFTGINHFKFRDPRRLESEDMDRIVVKRSEIEDLPLWIDDTGGIHINQLVSRARLLVRREKVKLVIVDYIQIVSANGKSKIERVSEVSASLREFAKRENVHVMELSQLSRPDKRDRHARPTMFDLKESGDIEQDAHCGLLLFRPKGDREGEDEIIIGKQRNGPTGAEKVFFHKETMTFKPRE